MPAAVLLGELRHRSVDHGQLIGARVGGGVACPQHPRQGLTSGIEGAEHGMEAKAALEMAGRLLLVGRVDLHQRGVDIEDHLACHRRPEAIPQSGSGRRPGRAQGGQHAVVDSVDRSPDRRRRCHLPEQIGLIAQRRHIRDAFPAAGQHDRHLGQ